MTRSVRAATALVPLYFASGAVGLLAHAAFFVFAAHRSTFAPQQPMFAAV